MANRSENTALRFSSATEEALAVVAVVAEIGVNHDGESGVARRLIDAAADAGADAVKFQYFQPDRLLSNQAELASYQQGQAASQRELLARLSLPIDTLAALVEYAHAQGLWAVVTPFSLEDPADLTGLGLDAVKTASPDAVNTPLLQACTKLDLPMLISTGTCGLDELDETAALLDDHEAGGAMLHCVSSYPTPLDQAQLGGIAALADRFGCAVGYSDHTPHVHTGALAVTAGAVVLEKHLTYDRQAQGPDHAASLDPLDFKQYVNQVRESQAALGMRSKLVGEIEHDVRRVSRQSVCVVSDLPAGHVLSANDLTIKRPGTGVPAAELERVIGRRLVKPVSANNLLLPGDLEA